jgi:ureidoglycolate hydrolase
MTPMIDVTEISKENYQPFGQFVCLPTHKPTIEADIVKYWANLAGFEIPGTIDVGWVTMKKRPFILTQLERHLHTVEVVIPLDDAMVLPVAIGREPFDYHSQPDPKDVRGFTLRPGQLVTFAPGVWHFGGFPLNKSEASFMVLTRRGTGDTDVSMQSILGVSQVEFKV